MEKYADLADLKFESLQHKRVLITGADGMLGMAFRQEMANLAPLAVVRATTRANLDVREAAAFSAHDSFDPEIVIHCAALVDADYCEEHRDEGYASIVGGTSNAIVFAKRHGASLFYPQSFLAFDGGTVIDEETLPGPMNFYGELKAEAERLVLEQLSDSALVVRMVGFFGGG
jgi:dTDP-4-dehydrorhamnose reductase